MTEREPNHDVSLNLTRLQAYNGGPIRLLFCEQWFMLFCESLTINIFSCLWMRMCFARSCFVRSWMCSNTHCRLSININRKAFFCFFVVGSMMNERLLTNGSAQEDSTRWSYSLMLWVRTNVGKKRCITAKKRHFVTDVCILYPEVCGHMLCASKLLVHYSGSTLLALSLWLIVHLLHFCFVRSIKGLQ